MKKALRNILGAIGEFVFMIFIAAWFAIIFSVAAPIGAIVLSIKYGDSLLGRYFELLKSMFESVVKVWND